MAILELDQSCETPLTDFQRGPFRLRYAYARSKDCQEHGERGQDYLVWRVEPFRAAFALCDGVGQSFFGGIGAQVVGEALLQWLWNFPLDDVSHLRDSNSLTRELHNFLDSKRAKATKIISEKDIKSVEDEFVRDALEARLKTRGTQSNFVCGIVDIPSHLQPKGRVYLFWLGDAKLQIWKKNSNQTPLLHAAWNKQEGWSSNFGTSGEIHCFQGSLADLDFVIAHSDGVDPIQQNLSPALPTSELERKLGQLGDDDASLMELFISEPSADLEDDVVSMVRESPLLPVKIISLPAKAKATPPPYEKEEKGINIPSWIYILFSLAIVFVAIGAGMAGYSIGRNRVISAPTVLPPPTIAPPPQLPSATPFLPPTEIPTLAPASQATVDLLPPGAGVILTIPDGLPSLLEPDKCYETNGVGSITVIGPFQVWAYSEHGCSGSPFRAFVDGNNLPLTKDIQSIRVIILPNP